VIDLPVLAIPLGEIAAQFSANTRQDVKIIVPLLLGEAQRAFLEKTGRTPKPEIVSRETLWRHAGPEAPNRVYPADGLPADTPRGKAPFSLGFANENTPQLAHYHRQQTELFYSEHLLSVRYRHHQATTVSSADLPDGGALICFPGVVHHIRLTGLTLVLGLPAVSDDKQLAAL